LFPLFFEALYGIVASGMTFSVQYLLQLTQAFSGIFSRFPLFTASIASAAFFGITLAVVGGFLISSMQHFTNYDTPPEDQSASNLAISGEAAELSERPLRRRSSKRKSVRRISGAMSVI
jgi:hypothetical protein